MIKQMLYSAYRPPGSTLTYELSGGLPDGCRQGVCLIKTCIHHINPTGNNLKESVHIKSTISHFCMMLSRMAMPCTKLTPQVTARNGNVTDRHMRRAVYAANLKRHSKRFKKEGVRRQTDEISRWLRESITKLPFS